MKNTLAALACIALAASLTGCADFRAVSATYQKLQDATIPANVALVVANSFDAVELTASHILTVCTPMPSYAVPAVCKTQRPNIKTMNASILAGRPIRNAIEPTDTGQASPVSKSAYDKLQAIVATLTAAVTAFNVANGA